jgi:Mlc titration factor MtfA (ptsG expression regulator)
MWHQYINRDALLAEPFPEEWELFLVQNVAHFSRLSDSERTRLRADLRVLVAEKNWEGCRGQRINDEVKVTIAAQASLLLLGMKHDYFARVLSILVYPSLFLIPEGDWWDEYDVKRVVAGQAVYRGPVIIAWDEAFAEGRDPSCGENVVIHEFAHQLDFQDGEMNGTPDLPGRELNQRWYEVMTSEFSRLRRNVHRGRGKFLGEYAAKDETEFFAVASERFFSRPARLRKLHPALYDILAAYYGVDPSRWFPVDRPSPNPS